MQPSKPWNITTINMEDFIKNNFLGEVTSPMMYEPSSTSFHPNGLYSERIFGQIGTPERISKLGYISLHCEILNPVVYLNIVGVCSWYKELMESKVYAIYNDKDKEFVIVDRDHKDADTGFAFFMRYVKHLQYQKNTSRTRSDKIDVIAKSIKDDTCTLRHFLVCPAGWRDVKTDNNGKIEIDAVNKLFTSLLVMSTEIKNGYNSPLLGTFFNNVKYHLQLKVVELFDHWKTFYDGKTGFGQGHYSKRNLALGTRGVITTPPMLSTSPNDPSYIKHNDTQLPLYHCAKAFSPVVVHALNVLFTSQVYTLGSIKVPAIDPTTLSMTYVEVDPATVTYALDSKSKHDFINAFANTTGRHDPVTIDSVDGKKYWMWMVYDLDDEIYLFRNIKDLEELINDRSSNFTLGKESISKDLYHIFGSVPDMEFFKKEGLLSPKVLYEKNKELFHKTVYDNYHGRASTFLSRTDLDDKDILNYLDNDPRRKDIGLSSSSIFFSLSGKDTLTHIDTTSSTEVSISVDTLKKAYSQYPPILIQGITSKQLTWEELENNWEKYQQLNTDGINEQLEKNSDLVYKHIPHIAINCGSIPAKYFTITEKQKKTYNNSNIQKVKHLDKLDKLRLSTDEYLIGASASAIMHGMDIENDDLDILVIPEALNRIKDTLIPGEKDGIHDHMYSDTSGKLDIGPDNNWFNWETFYPLSEVIDGYRFLSYDGALLFYQKLYSEFGRDKHKTRLDWLLKNNQKTSIPVTIDRSKVRPLTKIEMLYIATYKATNDKMVQITRFPAIEVGSTYPSNAVVLSTSPARSVLFKSQYSDMGDVLLANYPVHNRMQYTDSTILHPSKTTGLTADFDGDKVSVNGIMATEALQEAKQHLNSASSIVSPGGKFYDTLDTKVVTFSVHALTMLPDGVVLPTVE